MKKIVFIDRDGTIIYEPEDEVIDSLEKLVFLPRVIQSLNKLSDMGYEFVMVSNQDGLGTDAYPRAGFDLVQAKLLQVLDGEGIQFLRIYIDEHFESENHPNRKPGLGMLRELLDTESIDMANSYMIGDRMSDAVFAKNLGCQSLTIKDARSNDADKGKETPTVPTERFSDWDEIIYYISKRR